MINSCVKCIIHKMSSIQEINNLIAEYEDKLANSKKRRLN